MFYDDSLTKHGGIMTLEPTIALEAQHIGNSISLSNSTSKLFSTFSASENITDDNAQRVAEILKLYLAD